MTIDVVVVAYRSAAHLRACVEPLCGQSDVNVFVVDNDCPEDSPSTLTGLPVEIVRMGRNAGFAAGCNAGAARGNGDVILFLNPDAAIALADVRRLAAHIRDDMTCGAVAPRIFNSSGEIDWTMRRMPRLSSAFGEALFLHHLVRRSIWPTEFVRSGYHKPADPEWLIGAALCVRRTAFAQIGGFDERFFLYSEDTDVCTRLRRAGYSLRYEPGATAHHVGGGSGPRTSLAPLNASARITYARLHSKGLRYLGFRVAYALHELLRLPYAMWCSPEDFRARLRALRVALGVEPTPAFALVPQANSLSRSRSRA